MYVLYWIDWSVCATLASLSLLCKAWNRLAKLGAQLSKRVSLLMNGGVWWKSDGSNNTIVSWSISIAAWSTCQQSQLFGVAKVWHIQGAAHSTVQHIQHSGTINTPAHSMFQLGKWYSIFNSAAYSKVWHTQWDSTFIILAQSTLQHNQQCSTGNTLAG